jgi:hypothetical protein
MVVSRVACTRRRGRMAQMWPHNLLSRGPTISANGTKVPLGHQLWRGPGEVHTWGCRPGSLTRRAVLGEGVGTSKRSPKEHRFRLPTSGPTNPPTHPPNHIPLTHPPSDATHPKYHPSVLPTATHRPSIWHILMGCTFMCASLVDCILSVKLSPAKPIDSKHTSDLT